MSRLLYFGFELVFSGWFVVFVCLWSQISPVMKARLHKSFILNSGNALGYQMDTMNMALWYSSKAKLYKREAEKYFKQFKCPECASAFEESMEFATKAICEFLGENYGKKHDISDVLIKLSVKFPQYKEELSRAAWISSRWVGMAQRARTLVRYGNQDAKVPATRIVKKEDMEPIRADTLEICKLLRKIEVKQTFGSPIKLGILDGRVEEFDASEKPCNAFPYNEFKRIDVWKERLSQIFVDEKKKYDIENIPISKVSNEFAVIINPFGEAYPEKDIKNRWAFNVLKDYIADGGIYVNTAGFPFFWAWDVIKGKEEPVVDVGTLVPASIRIEEGKVVIEKFEMLLNFAGSLFWREFDALTTSDTPIFKGINELEIYQTDKDREIAGDLINVGNSNKVHEFRALRKESKGLIPLLRASRPDFQEVYPIAALQYDWGYLITAGMHMTGNVEFEKLIVALDNFCTWLPKSME